LLKLKQQQKVTNTWLYENKFNDKAGISDWLVFYVIGKGVWPGQHSDYNTVLNDQESSSLEDKF